MKTQIEFSDDFLLMTGGLSQVNGKKVMVWLHVNGGEGIDGLRMASRAQLSFFQMCPRVGVGVGG